MPPVCQSLAGGGLQSLTRLHHQLVVVPAGDPEVDVAEHDRAERLLERLVGATKPDPGRPEIVLDPERHGGVAREPGDRLHDDAIERTRSLRRGGEEVVDAAVGPDWDGEARQAAFAASRQRACAGLDVVVVGDDTSARLGHAGLGVSELARKREGWVLLVLRGDPAVPRIAGGGSGRRWRHGCHCSSACPTSTSRRTSSASLSALPCATASTRPASPPA